MILASLLALVTLGFGGQLLFSGWSSTMDGGIHRFHEVSWGVIEGIVLLVALVAQLRHSGRRAAHMQQVLAGSLALLVVMAAIQTFDPFTAGFIAIVLVLLALHPEKRDALRLRDPDRVLVGLASVAAIPMWMYAASEVAHHLAAPATDPHADLAHYAGTAAAAIAIPLVALVASSRRPGASVAALSAGVGAAVLGIAGTVFPNQSSSVGTIGGALAIAWGVAFLGTAVLRARHVGIATHDDVGSSGGEVAPT